MKSSASSDFEDDQNSDDYEEDGDYSMGLSHHDKSIADDESDKQEKEEAPKVNSLHKI